jgi:hypothetical protein
MPDYLKNAAAFFQLYDKSPKKLFAKVGLAEFEKIFSTANTNQILKNIYDFVENQLRAYRPGLILQPEQLLQMLINGLHFQNELIKHAETKAKKEISLSYTSVTDTLQQFSFLHTASTKKDNPNEKITPLFKR